MNGARSYCLAARCLFCLLLFGSAWPALAAGPAQPSGPELLLQTGHTQPIRCLAVSPDGK
jgi:hypothetical protein